MEISIKLNDENSKRLSSLKDNKLLDLDLDNICNDSIKQQLDNCEQILFNWSKHFECRSKDVEVKESMTDIKDDGKMDDIEFPEWKGYENLEGVKQLISHGCYNDGGQILGYAAKMFLEREYFKGILMFVQKRIQKHIEEGEGLGLGLDSSREIFEGLMIVPADVTFPEEENEENDKDNYEQFIKDMEKAGIEYDGEYNGRFFYHGPAVRTNEKGFPTRQDVIRATKVALQWDNLGLDFIVYPYPV